MRLIPIINRLNNEVSLLNGNVETAKSLVSLPDDELDNDLPICFLYTQEETSEANEHIDGVLQQAGKTFAVMYAAEQSTNELEPLEDLRDEVKKALLGWSPDPDNISPISYEKGKILNTSERVVWWVDYFNLWQLDEYNG